MEIKIRFNESKEQEGEYKALKKGKRIATYCVYIYKVKALILKVMWRFSFLKHKVCPFLNLRNWISSNRKLLHNSLGTNRNAFLFISLIQGTT